MITTIEGRPLTESITLELIARAQHGSPDDAGELYARYYQRIYRYLYYRTGDPKIAEDLTADVFVKMVQTVEIAIWGTLLSVLLSIPLAYLAARNYTPSRFTYTLARGSISLLRSAPELIVALFLVLAYGFGPIAGVLALGLHAAGFLGKFYAEDIENADKKSQEALEAIGAGKLKTLWYGVLPQVLPQYIAYTLYILDRNIRMATVIGLVGAGGIGQELKGRFDMFQYDHVATILIAIFIVVFLLDQFSARLRARLI